MVVVCMQRPTQNVLERLVLQEAAREALCNLGAAKGQSSPKPS